LAGRLPGLGFVARRRLMGLRLYLAHFRGRSGVNVQLMGTASEPTTEPAWAALTCWRSPSS